PQRGGLIRKADSASNVVEGNYIGTNKEGDAGLGNTQSGVQIQQGAHDNTIGGLTSSAGNVISANLTRGVWLTGAGTTNNVLFGNFIGTNSSGSTTIGNDFSGVLLDQGASNNMIGGPSAGAGNTIGFNVGAGVNVLGASTTGNSIRGNLIYRNGGLGIDLGGDGVTENHLGSASG